MRKLIIRIDEDKDIISDLDAVNIVESVIKFGRVSKNNQNYAYGVRFQPNDIVCYADKTTTGTDTFRIWRQTDADSQKE